MATLHNARLVRRALAARPALTLACAAVTALGVGASLAVATAASGLLRQSLPVPASDRLVTGFALREGFDPFGTSLLEFQALHAAPTLFEGAGLAQPRTVTVGTGLDTVQVQGAVVTAEYLSTVGVLPLLGQPLSASHDQPGAAPTVWISHSLWQQQFGGQPVLGSRAIVNGEPRTIVGVMPAGFDLPARTEVWFPLQLAIESLPVEQRLPNAYTLVARLRPGATIESANRLMSGLVKELALEYPQRRGWTYRIVGLRQQLIGDIDGRVTRAILLVGGSTLFLLVVCAINVGNLLVLHHRDRLREVTIRRALGATERRLALERVALHAVIGLLGGVGGAVAAWWGGPALAALHPVEAAAFSGVLLDFRPSPLAIASAIGLSTVSVALMGLALRGPATTRRDLSAVFAAHGSRAGMSPTQRRYARVLVVAQLAAAALLLAAGGLLLQTYRALGRMDLGFRPAALTAFHLTLPGAGYADHRRRVASLHEVSDAIRSLPGIDEVGWTTNIPLEHGSIDSLYTVAGRVQESSTDVPITAHRVVSPDYLSVIGARLVTGRLLLASDDALAPRVVVVTEEFASQAWPDQDPIGRQVKRGRQSDDRPWLSVVGVIANLKEDRFNFRTDRAGWYLPYEQEPTAASPTLVVRSSMPAGAVGKAIRERVTAVDPTIGLSDQVSLDRHVAEVMSTERFAAVLMNALATAATALSIVGLYGVLAYVVASRRREMALRLAIGASRAQVLRMLFREVALIVAAGVAIGLGLAAITGRALSTILYRVSPHDATTYGAVALGLAAISFAAAGAPAWRAARVEPARELTQ